MQKPLVSIMIPAYNKPEYTRKTLQSIVEQEYRPIEVILSDDCSPISLEPLVAEFRHFESDVLSIEYYRQETNIRGDNVIFLFDRLAGKYALYMPHDDWLTDKRFLTEAVEIMENNPECYLCVANSEIEKTNGQRLIKLPSNIDAKDKWLILEGKTYINLLGGDKIGYQAWSAIVFNIPIGRSLGALHYPFNIPESLAKDLGIMPDDGFAFQFLLSSIGSVAVTEKVVSVRGMPDNSYSRSAAWSKVVGQAQFIIHYNLYRAKLEGKYAQAMKKRAKEIIFHYPVERINLKIIRHYNYKPEVILLMFLSYALHLIKLPLKLPRRYVRYYIDIFQRAILKTGNKEPLGFKRILLTVREQGLRRCLFPFR